MKSNETINEIIQKYIAGESTLQWVHKEINKLKSDFDQKKFKELCCLVASKAEKIING